ncbi:corrinoid ABC transporter permease [Limnochorda pilosa]|uniref:Corrinoid ABC transporter permease n=1 Tax=Limnochorda pilosa TaxID=1555112 RepID=A0A0K2SND8_LIMPI|nr:corrinoid ABC transporter permease [Limnochorda pilosa]
MQGSGSSRRLRPGSALAAAALLLAGVALVSAALGPAGIGPLTLLQMVGARLSLGPVETPWPQSYEAIFFQVRLPRVVLGALIGAALGVAGTTLQGLFRNPMADPYILGVSGGASVGAVLALTLAGRAPWLGFQAVPGAALLFALTTVALVYRLARVREEVPMTGLLLAGVAVSALCSALVSLVLTLNRKSAETAIFWLMGSLSGASWREVAVVTPYFAAGALLAMVHARELNLLLLGEEAAYHLGVEPERVKRRLLFTASVMAAAAVSVSGVIGFVGLIVPHAVRLVMGPDHRLLIPVAGLMGATLLVASDTLARMLLSPVELPVGVVTALAGVPFFLWLLRRHRASLV